MQRQTVFHRRIVSLAALAAAVACLTTAATAQPPVPSAAPSNEPIFEVNSPKENHLKIIERFSKIVELKNKIVRVDGFDPAVVNVTALSPTQLRVQATAPGVTTLVVTDETDEIFSIEVFVTGDVRHLQAYLGKLFPRAAVEAVAVRDSVVLRGWVTQPEHITEMVEIAEQFYPRVLNQMRVGGVQQVLLHVKVMEVQRSKIRRLGINWYALGENGEFFSSTPGSLVPLAGVAPVEVAAEALPGTTNAFAAVTDGFQFSAFIDALREEALLKILAEPELVTTNGRPAHLLSGGEFPILVPQSLGTTTIQWRQFGVSLEAVPIILGNGRVRLELQPEVSERDFTNAVDVNGFTVPGLTTRRVNTQVEMQFGQTFILAGLLSMRNTAQTDKTPFFGELPWIGAAFRRVRYDEVETELVIMVTPELVAPLDHAPPGGPGLFTDTPTDRELFRDGMIEVPYYGDHCADGSCLPGGLIGPGGMPLPGGPIPIEAVPVGPTPVGPPPGQPIQPYEYELGPSPSPILAPPPAPPAEAARRHPATNGQPRMTIRAPTPQGARQPVHAGTQPPSPSRPTRPGLIQPKPRLIGPETAPAAPPPETAWRPSGRQRL